MPIKAETLHDEAALLKELFAKHSKLSQKDFAKTFDIGTPALLWQYLNGRKALGLKAAIKIATGLGVDVGAFSPRLARELRDLASPNVSAASGMQKRIPILSDVQAGSPNGGDVEARETAIDQGNYVIGDADLSDECFALTIQGRSMEPDFVQGDIIIVDPSISPSPVQRLALEVLADEDLIEEKGWDRIAVSAARDMVIAGDLDRWFPN